MTEKTGAVNPYAPLTEQEVTQLTSIATSQKSGKYLAQSVLENYNEVIIEEIVVLPQVGSRAPIQNATQSTESQLDFFEIYPNPATDEAFITFKIPEEASNKAFLNVYDPKGSLVKSINLSNVRNIYRLDVSDYAAGNYSIVFEFSDRSLVSKHLSAVK